MPRLKVSPWDQDAIRVSWPPEDNPPFDEAIIERSESPEGPWDELAPPQNEYEYLDTPINLKDKWRSFYYRVTLKDEEEGIVAELGPKRITTHPDTRALEIVRRNRLLLREYIAPDVSFLVKKRSEGTRCPECWDDIKMRVKKSDCGNCNGTGFVDGFLKPIPLYVSYGSASKVEQPSPAGTEQPSQTQAWTTNYPVIRPRDVLVEPYFSNQRWRIVNVRTTRKKRYPLRQIMNIKQIDPEDPAMDVEVPEGDEKPTPAKHRA